MKSLVNSNGGGGNRSSLRGAVEQYRNARRGGKSGVSAPSSSLVQHPASPGCDNCDNRHRVHPVGLTLEQAAARVGMTVSQLRRLPIPAIIHGPGGRQLLIDPASLVPYQRAR